jgi:hypothetical protein
MNHAIKAIDHENKIRRWQTFTPPQRTAYAAHCGLVLHWRAYSATPSERFLVGMFVLTLGPTSFKAAPREHGYRSERDGFFGGRTGWKLEPSVADFAALSAHQRFSQI